MITITELEDEIIKIKKPQMFLLKNKRQKERNP